MLKVLTIVGARPQFIKAAVVSRAMKDSNEIEEILVHTGQHFDYNMSQIFFEEMEIPKPAVNLDINAMSHGAMTGRMLEGIEQEIIHHTPDWVLVYGDTNSTLAGALAASKLHVKVAHVEAGLRSFNMRMPEEQNRILTDRLSTLLFCPTEQALRNLEKEGYSHFDNEAVVVGDVMFDSAIHFANLADKKGIKGIRPGYSYVLATCHRQENTDDPALLHEIFSALEAISEEAEVVMPIHPRTRKILGDRKMSSRMHLIDPVGYLEMTRITRDATMVITDSGGLQKEAFFFGKPCITIRDQTEWVELVGAGANILAGANKAKILDAFRRFRNYEISETKGLYGNGNASSEIVKRLLSYEG